MGTIEGQYNIYYINDKRIYMEDFSKNPFVENSIPYLFEYKNIRIYESAWNRLTLKILEAIDSINPKDESELLKLSYSWSKAPVFSKIKQTNFQQFKGIYLNTNHTAIHAWMNIQLLLKTYNIPLEDCIIHIIRHPSAEAKEVQQYYRNIAIDGYRKVLLLVGLSQKNIETVYSNMEIINKKFLSEVSKGFNDFYLFDNYYYFVNYKLRTIEYVKKKYFGTPYVAATERGLSYLDIYYRNKQVFDNYSKVNYLLKNRDVIDKEIMFLFNQSPIKAISISKLLARIRIVNPEFISVIKPYDTNDSFYALMNALFYKKYFFKKPFISIDDTIKLSYDDLIMSYIFTLEKFSTSEINSYCDKMHFKRLDSYLKMFQDISEEYVQISVDTCIAKDSFLIKAEDIAKVRSELQFYINSFGSIDTRTYNGYTQLPKIEYEWNKYLLIGIIRTYLKDDFDVECTSNAYDLTDYIIKIV